MEIAAEATKNETCVKNEGDKTESLHGPCSRNQTDRPMKEVKALQDALDGGTLATGG